MAMFKTGRGKIEDVKEVVPPTPNQPKEASRQPKLRSTMTPKPEVEKDADAKDNCG